MSEQLDAVESAIRPLWGKARTERGECFRASEDSPRDEDSRNCYYFNEGLENAYRDALNFIARARLLPTDKSQP